jgi:putative hydrolase of the HAD superfamily
MNPSSLPRRSMSRFRAVIFDLDDTLYPEIEFVFSGFRAVSQWCHDQFGFPPDKTFTQLTLSYQNGNRADTFNRWFQDNGIDASLHIKRAIEVYRAHAPVINCFPGAIDMLARLKSTLRLGLVSDGYYEVQQRKLEALGIGGFFDAIVFSDRWGSSYWKPHPRPFVAALEMLGANAGNAMYVADNPEKDFVGARSLGIWTVQLRRPDGIHAVAEPASPEHAPHVTISDILELEGLLASLTLS